VSVSREHGLEAKLLHLDGDRAATLERLEELITPRTRMIFVSHVSCLSGIRLPVKEITEIAHSRGALCMVDGAHAVGVVPVDMRQIGCDFYAANCHKWLMGPQGTAFLYVREDRLDQVRQTWTGAGSTKSWSVPDLPFEPADGAKRFEFGSHPYALFAALPKSLDLVESLGVESIRTYAVELTAMLKDALADLRGVELWTPRQPEDSASLVAFYTDGLTEPEVAKRLWSEHNTIVSSNAQNGWMRVSAACFTLREELDHLVEILRKYEPAAA
jgi:selenocysteine lyase/cysteine desulfurase